MQLAFARVKETWEEAYLTNLANHPLDAVLEKIRTAAEGGAVHDRRMRPGRRGQGARWRGRSTTSRRTCARTLAPATNA